MAKNTKANWEYCRIKARQSGFDAERKTGGADMEPCRLRRCGMEQARFDDEEVL